MDFQPLAIFALLSAGLGGGIGIYTAAAALGFRHGIDWDHIAAITDITSATASVEDSQEAWLIGEPGVMITDETHHETHGPHDGHVHADGEDHVHEHQGMTVPSGGPAAMTAAATVAVLDRPRSQPATGVLGRLPREHRTAMWHGSLYALGHGTIVTVLGIIAILAAEFLPGWIDGVMERVVGVTLIFLSAYLFYSLYQYFRGGGEFRIRSRWMLVFAGAANAWYWVRSRVGRHEHVHVQLQSYTARTAYAIGVIHGIGAETGTQALIIATAVGATSKGVAITALLFFVFGLLVSNSFVTFASTTGFVSARRRRLVYVGAGVFAAVFSLLVGLVFLNASTGILPDLDRYFHWVGGPNA